jgi:hypothetical protein
MEPYMGHVNGGESAVRVAVVGGGAGGSTVALRLAEQGIHVTLFEQGPSLVNGPPVCHLHAGGSLYRELSDEHCITLLEQSIDTVKSYPHAVKVRPTVIAVPKRDAGSPEAIIPRLQLLQQRYMALIADDALSAVLGHPDDFFQLFDKDAMLVLAKLPRPEQPKTPEDWMIPLAHDLDLDALKYPLIQVQEYGVSLFRLAASVDLALSHLPMVQLRLESQVVGIEPNDDLGWDVLFENSLGGAARESFDYLINACGYRSGALDDWAGFERSRMVEFKAAYVARWENGQGIWPEVVFHGERGTPNGMAQLTPYADGVFQLHGMTEEITLFDGGLVQSELGSAQPNLPAELLAKIQNGWPLETVEHRTRQAIKHVSQFVPRFLSAEVAGKPLFGAQQIPGDDPKLRTGSASFSGRRYARTEIVKLSSALSAADAILTDLARIGLWHGEIKGLAKGLVIPRSLSVEMVIDHAQQIARTRGYPTALAK